MFALKLFVWVAIGIAGAVYASYESQGAAPETLRDVYLEQFQDKDSVPISIRRENWNHSMIYTGAISVWVFLGVLLFYSDATKAARDIRQ